MNQIVLGLIRHILSVAGASLATQGYMTGEEVQTAVGAVVALLVTVWSVYSKRKGS